MTRHSASPRSNQWALLILAALVVIASVVLSPSAEAVRILGVELPPLCGFRRLTGWSCPGCGLTRSFVFMGHGMLVDAWGVHKLGPALFVLVSTQIPWRVWKLWRARNDEP